MAEERDFRTRLSEALMAGGDTINNAFGGKQNIYGTYQEQKTKREQMEREALKARAKQQFDTINALSKAKPEQEYVAGYDELGNPVQLRNTNYNPNASEAKIIGQDIRTQAQQDRLPITPRFLSQFGDDRAGRMAKMQFLRSGDVTQSPATGRNYYPDPIATAKNQLNAEDVKRRTLEGEWKRFSTSGQRVYADKEDEYVNRLGRNPIALAKTLGIKSSREGDREYYQLPNETQQLALIESNKKIMQTYDKEASGSRQAIEAFNSLKEDYYAGFQPVDLQLDKATLLDTTGAKMSGFMKQLEGKLGGNPASRAYMNNVQAMATTIARGAFGEKGTLTDKDRDVVIKMFNMALANKDEADYAFSRIEQVMYKPAIRAARYRIERFGEGIDSVELPESLKDRVGVAKESGFSDLEIIDYLYKNAGKL